MAELERCQRESQGYSYVFLGCQKYGFRPFPAKIPQDVFEQLRAAMAADCQALLDECFRLDTNVYPAPSDPAADIRPKSRREKKWPLQGLHYSVHWQGLILGAA